MPRAFASPSSRAWLLLWGVSLLLPVTGCDCGSGTVTGSTCMTSTDCTGGRMCVDGRCIAGPDAGVTPDAATGDGGCRAPCSGTCCDPGSLCVGDMCVAQAPCASDDDCENDSYCDMSAGLCVPYGPPPGRTMAPTCTRVIPPGAFQPAVQCEFSSAPAGDPFPNNLNVLPTPMVADFRIDRAPDDPPHPSIVGVFHEANDGGSEEPDGVIRILDGATCTQQWELGSLQLVSASSPPAIGDLDGDGRPDIVDYQAGGGLVAFHWDETAHAWAVLWHSTDTDGVTPYNPTGGGWAGPTIVDLDDDGVPEVLREGMVFDHTGRLLDDSLGEFPNHSAGLFDVVADVDGNGRADLITGAGAYEWDPTMHKWAPAPWSMGGTAQGRVAIADFGDFPGAMGWPPSTPEVAVISAGMARVQTLDGTTVFGPVALPGGGSGGPPTIADFDGDGRPEFASAGGSDYTVFDLDCTDSPVGTCGSGRTDGILWAQPSQDLSSNVTGSSVFDFEGDGKAEAVYGDECFLRVYDGTTGDVLFSQLRSSCTWYENPVIADVDGDFNAEIVIGNNFNCGTGDQGVTCNNLDPGGLDPIFAGLHCADDSDCLSGTCDMGLCRCTTDADCCTGAGCDGLVCAAPPAGTPGTGNTCRSGHPHGIRGIRVYHDTADRWVRSRMIWNQHAYFVTNVNDDGTIPQTSAMMDNWSTAGLNNFRENVQGSAIPGAAPDLTSRGDPVSCDADGTAHLTAHVCNRGSQPVGPGMAVGFYDGDPDAGGTLLCEAMTTTVLDLGECAQVSCDWPGAPTMPPASTSPSSPTPTKPPASATKTTTVRSCRASIAAPSCSGALGSGFVMTTRPPPP